ncbi:MAG: hypothetical protein QOG19_2860 [Mycobacterium sp.]|jgi:hypothetical protein|nr:hypothetical protein [Mycobacterium sp.]
MREQSNLAKLRATHNKLRRATGLPKERKVIMSEVEQSELDLSMERPPATTEQDAAKKRHPAGRRADLSKMTLDKLAERANNAHEKLGGAAQLPYAIQAGQALVEAKARFTVHGEWKTWLDGNFQGSARSAQVYMTLARKAQTSAVLEAKSIDGALKTIRDSGKKSTPSKPTTFHNYALRVDQWVTDRIASAGLDDLIESQKVLAKTVGRINTQIAQLQRKAS